MDIAKRILCLLGNHKSKIWFIKFSMAQFSFFRFFSSAKMSIRDDFYENKKWYILCVSLVVAGIICGLIAGIKIAPDVSVGRIPDSFLRRFIDGDISIWGLFFSRILVDLCFLAVIFVTNCRPILCFVSLVLIAYRAFCMGITSTILIAIFKVGGALNVILVVLPSQLLLLAAMVIFAVMCISYNFGCKVYGGSIFCSEFFCCSRLAIYFVLLLVFCSIFVELLLLPWLGAFLIVS